MPIQGPRIMQIIQRPSYLREIGEGEGIQGGAQGNSRSDFIVVGKGILAGKYLLHVDNQGALECFYHYPTEAVEGLALREALAQLLKGQRLSRLWQLTLREGESFLRERNDLPAILDFPLENDDILPWRESLSARWWELVSERMNFKLARSQGLVEALRNFEHQLLPNWKMLFQLAGFPSECAVIDGHWQNNELTTLLSSPKGISKELLQFFSICSDPKVFFEEST